ncbi:MAG TPA: efflux RND transporter permease subunit [Vicinamibacterales bacterium]|jgi:HAE1 family hydrophobic/amphiphilic exporter-1|nr:efflux RND transporter permease subunit [Vicinamibacterales bacterium]
MSIPRLAIHRPVTMFMLSGVIVLLGAISLSKLPVDLMPEFTQPTITVNTTYANVGPLEIEELITRPIEQSVSAVAGITRVDSSSREGQSNVRLNFGWGTNLDAAADDVRSRLDRVRGRLPEEADPPTIFKADSNAMPIMQIGVEGDYDPVTLRELAENDLSPRLERAPGVAAVTIGGGLRRQIHVDLSKEKITALNLSVDRVVQSLRSENQNLPLGQIDQGDSTYLVRSQGQFVNIDDIRNLVVLTRENVPVYLKDVADVADATEDRRQFLKITSRDANGKLGEGHSGVRMQINKQSGENTVAVAQAIRAEVDRINRDVPGLRLIVLDDSAIFIERAINNVKEHALVGGILVVLIIFAFLRDFRSTLIVCTSIPISVIGTFALLYFGGFTLNTMTFGGLALGIGMIVDAAIVVLENTHRHLHMGKDRMTAAIDGSEEVWSAILASTLTHIAVFVPLLFLQGISSILFTQLSFVVMFSLSMSLFVAVTIVPVLCSRWLHTPDEHRQHRGVLGHFYRASERFLEEVDDGYRRAIHLALRHRPTVIGAAAGLVVLAAVLYPRVGTELLPQTDEGQVNINAQLPIGTRMEVTEAVMYRLEDLVKQSVPEATTIVTNGGGGGGFGGFGNTNRGQMQVKLVPRDQRVRTSDEISQDLRRRLSGIPGAIVRANPGGGNFQLNRILGGGDDARLSLEIRGHDLDDAKRIQQQAIALVQDTPGIADVRVGQDDARPELAIRVDRPKAAMLGLTVNGVAQTIQTNVAGTTAAQFRQRGNEYPIVVRLREADREQIQDIGDVLVNTPSGQVVPARNLLAVDRETGPVQIDRKNMERIVRVNAEPEVALSEAVTNVQGRLGQIRVPQDFSVGFGSEVEEQARSFNQLKIVLILAVLLVYAVMASQYESLRDPFIIMFSIPTASIGIVGGLLLTRTAFSMQAYIGVIMLAGIVVSNAILLVDYINTLRRRDGMPLREAVEIGGRTRLRPVLMTSIATMLGLVPMAIGIGDGGELQAPLARVVIGGLLASTMVTLVLIPAVYTLFEEGWKGLRHHPAE